MEIITESQVRFVAFQYIKQYFQFEKKFILDYNSVDDRDRLGSLQASANYFSVSRTFPKKFDPSEAKHDRLMPVLQILDRIREDKPCNDIVSLVKDTEKSLSSKYGDKSVLSATTKFLWLKGYFNVRVFDSQAKKALGFKQNYKSYDGFVKQWNEHFKQNKFIIEKVVAEMALEPNLIDYLCYDKMSGGELDALLKKEIIIARIYDMYLWQEGSVAAGRQQ